MKLTQHLQIRRKMRLLNKKEISDIKITVDKQNDALVTASAVKLKEFQAKIASINLILEEKLKETAIFITNAENQKQKLLNEVTSLEHRRHELKKPITTELVILEAKRAEIETRYAEIAEKEDALGVEAYNNNKTRQELTAREILIKESDERIIKQFEVLEKANLALKKEKEEFVLLEEKRYNVNKQLTESLTIQQQKVAEELKYVNTMKIELENQRIDILNRELKLEDRQKTLRGALEEAKKYGIKA